MDDDDDHYESDEEIALRESAPEQINKYTVKSFRTPNATKCYSGYKSKLKTSRDGSFVKTGFYYELGSLGANTGTQDWTRKRSMLERRVKYASTVQQANHNLIKPKGPIQEVKQYTLKDKAIDFAKSIPTPLPRKLEKLEGIKNNDNQTFLIENKLINDLDLKHQEYKRSVEEIRKKFII